MHYALKANDPFIYGKTMISVTPLLHIGESNGNLPIDVDTDSYSEAAAFMLLGMTTLVPTPEVAIDTLSVFMPREQAEERVNSVLSFDFQSIPSYRGDNFGF